MEDMEILTGHMYDKDVQIERLRALSKEMFEALHEMMRWMPSDFAPQSKADAMAQASAAITKFIAYEQKVASDD